MRRIALVCLVCLAGLAWACREPETIESYSRDGAVFFRLGNREFRFEPETAEAIGRGLIESAREVP